MVTKIIDVKSSIDMRFHARVKIVTIDPFFFNFYIYINIWIRVCYVIVVITTVFF
jgi:hypothetical protein